MEPIKKAKIISSLISLALLIIAIIGGVPYGFYTFLRIVISSTSAFHVYLTLRYSNQRWFWPYLIICLLFNPIIPVELTRSIWLPIDGMVLIFFVLSLFMFKLDKTS